MISKKMLVLSVAGIVLSTSAFASDKKHEGREDHQYRHEEMFKETDVDNDGKISKQEFTAKSEKHFDQMDKNKDGYLTQDEIKRPERPEKHDKKKD